MPSYQGKEAQACAANLEENLQVLPKSASNSLKRAIDLLKQYDTLNQIASTFFIGTIAIEVRMLAATTSGAIREALMKANELLMAKC